MSTTSNIDIAVRYSIGHRAVLLEIVPSQFLSAGVNVQWLSVFPSEAEYLYPQLTFLEPTGRTETIDVERKDGALTFTVIEVQAYFPS